MSPESLREKIIKAIDSGNVEVAHPRAEECFPLTGKTADYKSDWEFVYVDASPFKGARGHEGGLLLQWGVKGIGFGELTVYRNKEGWHADTESMGAEFMHAVLREWAKRIDVE